MPAPHPSASNRLPRAGIDPICSSVDALVVFAAQLSSPLRHETLVMLIDSAGCGGNLLTVTDTALPHQFVDVADWAASMVSHRPEISGMAIATVRPRGGVLADDDTLWFEADDVVMSHGLVLYDWLVIGRGGTRSLGDELGVPSRWPSRT